LKAAGRIGPGARLHTLHSFGDSLEPTPPVRLVKRHAMRIAQRRPNEHAPEWAIESLKRARDNKFRFLSDKFWRNTPQRRELSPQ